MAGSSFIRVVFFGPQIRDSAMGEFYTNLRKLSDQLFFEKNSRYLLLTDSPNTNTKDG